MSLACPKCTSALADEREPFGEQPCASCGGALLSARGTEHLLFDLVGLTPQFLGDESFPREHPFACPCGNKMRGLDVAAVPGRADTRDASTKQWVWPGDVRIDVCTTCGRAFLERGERDLLLPHG